MSHYRFVPRTPFLFCAIIGLLFAFGVPVSAVETLYVSAEAGPGGDGSRGKPFGDIREARDEIRRKTQAGNVPQGGFEVVLGKGTYPQSEAIVFEKQDSGTQETPIVYRAAAPGKAVLAGSVSIDPTAFKKVDDPEILARLDPAVRDAVVVIDLAALGVPALKMPKKTYLPLPVPELFFNGKRMKVASWPNSGWATIDAIVQQGDNPSVKDGKPGIFRYRGDRPKRWAVDRGVLLYGYWCYDWRDEAVEVAAIDTAKKEITFAAPPIYGLRQGNPSPRRFRAIHLLEELDMPGEYYVDPATNRLYFLFPRTIGATTITLACTNGPVVHFNGASHIVLRGFTVEESFGNGIDIQNGENVRLEGLHVRNIRNIGIHVNGGTGHAVRTCDVYETGAGGVHLIGGDRKTLTPGGHCVENCVIRGFSRYRQTYANGILLSGVANTARNNELSDAPHQAIAVSGNDHLFEYNKVHHVCLECDDCGAYYKGRNPSWRGNIVQYNDWRDIGGPMGHGNAAVYFDDGDGGDKVIGNLFVRCGDPGKGSFGSVFSHGGYELLAEGNVFVDCKRPLGSAPWNDKRWTDFLASKLMDERLRQEVDITSSVYTERYPILVGFLDNPLKDKRISLARRNLMIRPIETITGNWEVDPSNLILDDFNDFIDPRNGDYRIRPESEVFQKIPGFKQLPLEKMGTRPDPLRF